MDYYHLFHCQSWSKHAVNILCQVSYFKYYKCTKITLYVLSIIDTKQYTVEPNTYPISGPWHNFQSGGGSKSLNGWACPTLLPFSYHLVAITNPMLETCSVCLNVFFISNHFTRNLHVEGHSLKELLVLKAKFLHNFSMSNTFTFQLLVQ